MRILIVGGSGFAGVGLSRALKERGHFVGILDVVAPAESEAAFDQYEWKNAIDITPKDVDNYDVVVNFVAQADVPMGFASPRWTVQNNTAGTVALLEAVREAPVGLLAHASTANCYGRPRYVPIDEVHPLIAHNPYSASKIAQEELCWAWHRAYGIPVTIMSNGVVVGPGMRREIFVFKWLWNLMHARPIIIEGGGQTRDVTYADDTVQAWVKVVEAPRERVTGEKFIVSYGEEHSVAEIADWCLQECGYPSLELDPIHEMVVWAPYRPGEEGQREVFSTAKARKVLGYLPQVAPRDAIRRTAEWMRRFMTAERAVPSSLS